MTQPESRTVEERLAAALQATYANVRTGRIRWPSLDHYRSEARDLLAAAKEHGLVIGEGERLNVDALREALYTVSVRHNWEQMTDTVDRTEEIAAEYERLRR